MHLYLLANIPLTFQSALCSHQRFPAPSPRTNDLPGTIVDWVCLGFPKDLLALLHDTQMLDVLCKDTRVMALDTTMGMIVFLLIGYLPCISDPSSHAVPLLQTLHIMEPLNVILFLKPVP